MCIGVATANSILVVTFANDQQQLGKDAYQAAWAAGVTRLRPVLMTAGAMILGMLPMSLGIGEGGGTERASGPCGDWWPSNGHGGDTRIRATYLQRDAYSSTEDTSGYGLACRLKSHPSNLQTTKSTCLGINI